MRKLWGPSAFFAPTVTAERGVKRRLFLSGDFIALVTEGDGSNHMIAPAYNSANRRVVVTLERGAVPALIPPLSGSTLAISALVSPFGTPIHPKRTGKMINIYGEGETPDFEDYATEERFRIGKGGSRPLTLDPHRPPGLGDKSASDICLRGSPLSPITLDEIKRIARPGCRVTLAFPKSDGNNEELRKFRDRFPNRKTVFDGVLSGYFSDMTRGGLDHAPADYSLLVVELP